MIRASAEDVLEFVMDLRRYRTADKKVGPVVWLRRDGDRAAAWAGARFGGIPTPPGRIDISLTPYTRLDVRSVPAGLFRASFECSPADLGGTAVRHVECAGVPAPLHGAVRPWLLRSCEDELQRMKSILEGSGRG